MIQYGIPYCESQIVDDNTGKYHISLDTALQLNINMNHGAGRRMGRKNAARTLDQGRVDRQLAELDILTNCRQYPIDEAPAAYKDFNKVLDSVKLAGLASEVARLSARFVIKDGSEADD